MRNKFHMKTLRYVLDRISYIEKELPSVQPADSMFPEVLKPTKEQKRLSKELKLLTWVKILLETNPSEGYIDSELKRLIRFVNSKQDQYEAWCSGNKGIDYEKSPAMFRKEVGITEADRQIKMLRFILETGDKSKKAKK